MKGNSPLTKKMVMENILGQTGANTVAIGLKLNSMVWVVIRILRKTFQNMVSGKMGTERDGLQMKRFKK